MGIDRSKERPLFIAPREIEVGITPQCSLSMRLGKPHPSLGFDPRVVLAVELSPSEARRIAALSARKADEAEAGSPRAR
jgi:hypothetical protein